jgi:alcohol dehydrogenase
LRALVYDGELRLDGDYPRPTPERREALIRVTAAGICNTDLEIVRGYMGFRGVLGHEFVGRVEACDDGSWVGRRVVGEINCACGACRLCHRGLERHCPERTVLGIAGRDGALGEYIVLPAANLHAVPDSIPDEEAVFAEPLAAALEIAQQVHIRPADRAVVLGDGKLGLLAAQVLALTGCDLTAVGRHREKLAILADWGLNAREADEGISDLKGADLVVDCTGRPEGFDAARELVRSGGTLVLKSTFHGDQRVNLSSLVVDEVSLVGSRCGPFAPALRLLERGEVAVRPLIEGRFSLEEGLAAFDRAGEQGALKVLVDIA